MTSEQCKKGEDRQINYFFPLLRSSEKLDMIGHAYNPSTWKLRQDSYQPEVSLSYKVRLVSSLKQNPGAWVSLTIL